MPHRSTAQPTPATQLCLTGRQPVSAQNTTDVDFRNAASLCSERAIRDTYDASQRIEYASTLSRSGTPCYTYGAPDVDYESETDSFKPSLSGRLPLKQTWTHTTRYNGPTTSTARLDREPSHPLTTDLRDVVDDNVQEQALSRLRTGQPCSEMETPVGREDYYCAGNIPFVEQNPPENVETMNSEIITTSSVSSSTISTTSASRPPLASVAHQISHNCFGLVGLGLVREWQATQRISLPLRRHNLTVQLARVDSAFDLPNSAPVAFAELDDVDLNADDSVALPVDGERQPATTRNPAPSVVESHNTHYGHANVPAPSDPVGGERSNTHHGNANYAFTGLLDAFSNADHQYGGMGGSLRVPDNNGQGGSGQGHSPRSRAGSDGQERFYCIFRGIGLEQDVGGCATAKQYVSQLRRHHEDKHGFFYCLSCGPLANRQQRRMHKNCFEKCHSDNCSRNGEYLIDLSDPRNSCQHTNSQEDRLRRVFQIWQESLSLHPTGQLDQGPARSGGNDTRSLPGSDNVNEQSNHSNIVMQEMNSRNTRTYPLNGGSSSAPLPSSPAVRITLRAFAARAGEVAALVQVAAENGLVINDLLELSLNHVLRDLAEVEDLVNRMTTAHASQHAAMRAPYAAQSTPDTSTSSGNQAQRSRQAFDMPWSPYPQADGADTNVILPQDPTPATRILHTGAVFMQPTAYHQAYSNQMHPVGAASTIAEQFTATRTADPHRNQENNMY